VQLAQRAAGRLERPLVVPPGVVHLDQGDQEPGPGPPVGLAGQGAFDGGAGVGEAAGPQIGLGQRVQHRGGRGRIDGQHVLEIFDRLGGRLVVQGTQAGGESAGPAAGGGHGVAGPAVVPGDRIDVVGVAQRLGQRLQGVGDLGVQPVQAVLADTVEQRLAQQRVHEDVPAAGPGLEDPAVHGGGHRGDHPVG
jgi:hypothetical protein